MAQHGFCGGRCLLSTQRRAARFAGEPDFLLALRFRWNRFADHRGLGAQQMVE